MSGRWVRMRPDRADTAQALLAAGAVAASVGLVTFYLVRLLVARDEISVGGPPGHERELQDGERGA